jgi:hypothetical protein
MNPVEVENDGLLLSDFDGHTCTGMLLGLLRDKETHKKASPIRQNLNKECA